MGEPDKRRLTGHVRAVLDRQLPAGTRAVVAVSGGPDSVALLHLSTAARPDLDMVVGHVRHGLRDDAADAAAATANATLLGVPIDVVQAGGAAGSGPEDTARRSRYAALVGIARAHGARAILVGHTGDDQAETVLLRIARGTGLDGLGGMAEASERDGVLIIRPLLELRRADVRAVSMGLPTVEDPTNRDPDQRRARARHDALPALGRLRPDADGPAGGDAVAALMRLARLARRDVAVLEVVDQMAPPSRFGMAVVADTDRLVRLGGGPAATAGLRRRQLRAAWQLLPGDRQPPESQTLDVVCGLPDGGSVDLSGGVRGSRAGALVVLVDRDHARLPTVPLPVDQPVDVGGHDLRLTLKTSFATDGAPGSLQHQVPRGSPPWQADLAVPACGADGMVVRGRSAAGDRAARRALQRYPGPLRDHVPMVCSADGTILLAGSTVLRPPPPGQVGIRLVADRILTSGI